MMVYQTNSVSQRKDLSCYIANNLANQNTSLRSLTTALMSFRHARHSSSGFMQIYSEISIAKSCRTWQTFRGESIGSMPLKLRFVDNKRLSNVGISSELLIPRPNAYVLSIYLY